MPSPLAAKYIGVSETTLRTLGIPRRTCGAKRLYDKSDLDAFASSLPYEQKEGEGCEVLDGMFGVGS